jgi:hypothetical protein
VGQKGSLATVRGSNCAASASVSFYWAALTARCSTSGVPWRRGILRSMKCAYPKCNDPRVPPTFEDSQKPSRKWHVPCARLALETVKVPADDPSPITTCLGLACSRSLIGPGDIFAPWHNDCATRVLAVL